MSSNKPLMNRYLWAVGSVTELPIKSGELIAERYRIVAPQIWQDLQPQLPAQMPEQPNSQILPYLRLYPHRLHVPEVYGVCQLQGETFLGTPAQNTVVTLLENVPIDPNGELYPSLKSMWPQASPVRQIYWLWQILELWKPLEEFGVASSLLVAENLRVEGWRVRLRELYTSAVEDTHREAGVTATINQAQDQDSPEAGTVPGVAAALLTPRSNTSLRELGACWESWCRKASASVADRLQGIIGELQREKPSLKAIASQLNRLLLEQASLQPLRLTVAGATDSGPQQNHNEDSCYPTIADLPEDPEDPRDPLIPHLSIVCDGIGGHEGGEVASQLAVQSVKLQVRGLLAELTQDPEIMTPDLVAQQLEAIIRVANNLIASRNDEQERESRRRMGTTLIMALQLPQVVETANGRGNSHELYIANVGDSRAYWMTPRYCQQLTVDNDVAAREVKMGHSLYRQALARPDAGALTQAVGTRDAELLRPTVRRFILEEDGLLLLCSDGLSDNQLVERFCADYPKDVFSGKLPMEAALKSLISLANQQNGHDNTSVVLTYCAVSPQYPVVLNLGESPVPGHTIDVTLETELMANAQANESDSSAIVKAEVVKPATATAGDLPKVILGLAGVLLVLFSAGAAVLTAQWLLNPEGFTRMRDRFLPPQQEQVPESEEVTTPTSEE
ncbi:protein phosphatase 2C domain-containing protein [Lyngbya aestuarii]|uniref:protein phosphatase 2C domain-containing protein n=1 Tax=Lyngbya aestuarii TaxID=118322 RepID=UPI00403E1A11